ncbi:S8 family serine peptidase [Telluribacter sp. SYSU D00476]|uniref:S8 family peptidase n=1 Tax=Telluribacter sp. SYSU D00476 TaxID=2811430 RepID=UPI001FF17966|nr:S8 family serine peptidase [Telluribacter sp. SYSU D00476]
MTNFSLRSLICASILIGLGTGCTDQPNLDPSTIQNTKAARSAAAAQSDFIIQKGSYIIVSATNALPSNLEAEVSKAKGRMGTQLKNIGVATAVSADPDFAGKMERLPGIKSVIPDVSAKWIEATNSIDLQDPQNAVQATATNPNLNPYYGFQWQHKAINSNAAWQSGHRGEGVKVAILDTGYDLMHPDLAGNIIYSKSFVPNEGVQFNYPGFSHGTHVAGIVAALDNNIGVVGVAPKAKLQLIKVLSDSGRGSFSWILAGILDAVDQKADIINMSLGSYLPRNGKFIDDNGTPNDPSDDTVVSNTKAVQELLVAMSRVISYANQKGVTVIAAAGNDAINGNKDKSGISIPANLPHVLSVSATGPTNWYEDPQTDLDQIASYSNFGTSDISFSAPGGDSRLQPYMFWYFDMVLSTSQYGGYTFSAGTSMAAPHVAGVAALIIGKNGGPMAPARVEAALRASSDDLGKPGRDPLFGYGRVNALRAVSTLK